MRRDRLVQLEKINGRLALLLILAIEGREDIRHGFGRPEQPLQFGNDGESFSVPSLRSFDPRGDLRVGQLQF